MLSEHYFTTNVSTLEDGVLLAVNRSDKRKGLLVVVIVPVTTIVSWHRTWYAKHEDKRKQEIVQRRRLGATRI
jgi:hypothetical protein